MAWTTPKSWTPGEVPGATDFNTHLRDNLSYVHSGKPAAVITRASGGAFTYSIGAGSGWQPIDAANLLATIHTSTGRALITFMGTLYADTDVGRLLSLDVELDGQRIGGSDGLLKEALGPGARCLSLTLLRTGLSAGTHTFRLVWKIGGGVGYLFADNGTPAYFSVAEW